MEYERSVLGRTGLTAGRLGVAASYGVPAAAVEEAFERGANYLYWGSMRRQGFAQALRNLAPRRDRVVLVLQSYSRLGLPLRWSVERALRSLRYDYADVLLLGMWNGAVWERVLESAQEVQRRGLARHLAISTHHRPLVPEMAADERFGIFHVRYNAVHRGAESEVFPRLPSGGGPGIVSFTATSWGQLLKARRAPPGERAPSAADCYRFVLSQPAVNVCLTGPASAEQMRKALEGWRRGPMSAEELAWMRRVGDFIYSKGRIRKE